MLISSVKFSNKMALLRNIGAIKFTVQVMYLVVPSGVCCKRPNKDTGLALISIGNFILGTRHFSNKLPIFQNFLIKNTTCYLMITGVIVRFHTYRLSRVYIPRPAVRDAPSPADCSAVGLPECRSDFFKARDAARSVATFQLPPEIKIIFDLI